MNFERANLINENPLDDEHFTLLKPLTAVLGMIYMLGQVAQILVFCIWGSEKLTEHLAMGITIVIVMGIVRSPIPLLGIRICVYPSTERAEKYKPWVMYIFYATIGAIIVVIIVMLIVIPVYGKYDHVLRTRLWMLLLATGGDFIIYIILGTTLLCYIKHILKEEGNI